MSPGEAATIFAAGVAAGTVNAVVGSGSLITFPTLLAFGYSPVVANVSNNIGLVPGALSGAVGYRRELQGQRARLVALGSASIAGGLTGAVLLLAMPGNVFRTVVPVLILVACVMIVVQPRLTPLVADRRGGDVAHGGLGLWVTVFFTGVYGGYFGAAQGVILIALLAIFIHDDLQRLNGTKNVLAALVNGVAALLFIAFAHVAWIVVGLLAVGSTIGGQVGSTAGRRLPVPLLRGLIVVVGTAVAVRLLV